MRQMRMTNARQLTIRLAELLRREHAAMAEFLIALADFDRQRLWQDLGYSSLFYFLHRELGLSAGAAQHRKTAAELIERFPEAVEPLRDGRLCLSTVCDLAKVLTAGNRDAVLPQFFHLSKREAVATAAAIRPAEAAPHREVVTAVRAAPSATTVAAAVEHAPAGVARPLFHPYEMGGAPPSAVELPRPRDAAEPLTADLRRLHVTVSARFLAKIEKARAALSHARPGASTEEILEAGLDLLLEQHSKRKGLVAKPRKEPRPSKPDHLSAAVKRAVWTRDGGKCRWPLASGGVCGSTVRVEFDHVVPRSRGGPSTVDGVRLLCRYHNQYAARLAFGDAWMDRFTRSREVSATAAASLDLPGGAAPG